MYNVVDKKINITFLYHLSELNSLVTFYIYIFTEKKMLIISVRWLFYDSTVALANILNKMYLYWMYLYYIVLTLEQNVFTLTYKLLKIVIFIKPLTKIPFTFRFITVKSFKMTVIGVVWWSLLKTFLVGHFRNYQIVTKCFVYGLYTKILWKQKWNKLP